MTFFVVLAGGAEARSAAGLGRWALAGGPSSGGPPSIGTSRIPQIGQSPGRSDTIVGCIGQW